jgi:tripartite-type tricarboxylate transporter receptor subunit TctC
VIAALNRDFNAVIHSPEIRQRLVNDASIPVGSTSKEFTDFVRADIAKWAVAAKK